MKIIFIYIYVLIFDIYINIVNEYYKLVWFFPHTINISKPHVQVPGVVSHYQANSLLEKETLSLSFIKVSLIGFGLLVLGYPK